MIKTAIGSLFVLYPTILRDPLPATAAEIELRPGNAEMNGLKILASTPYIYNQTPHDQPV
jgi:hypothetical protein